MRISNTFCSIPPPKSSVLVPPPAPVTRALPNVNSFKPKILNPKIKSSIKHVITDLRGIVPKIDPRILCFLNVLDHFYYGSNKEDTGIQIKVTFNENVDYAFRRQFIALTKEGKDLFLSNVVKCRSSNLVNI